MKVEGQGYGDRALIVNPLNRLNPLLISMRLYSEDEVEPEDCRHIQLLEIETHPEYGVGRMSRLLVAGGREYLFRTEEFSVEPLDFTSSDLTSYSYPRRLRVFAESRGYKLDGEFISHHLCSVTDVMNESPLWLRLILILFLDRPVYFRCIGEFKGELKRPDGSKEQLRLFGPYEYVVVR